MKPGHIVLIRLPQARGTGEKLRPALVLALLPGPYQNVLVCGISTQIHLLQQDWDELLTENDPDFASSGLQQTSAVRLSYLYAAVADEIVGSIGYLTNQRVQQIRHRLIEQLQS